MMQCIVHQPETANLPKAWGAKLRAYGRNPMVAGLPKSERIARIDALCLPGVLRIPSLYESFAAPVPTAH